MSRKPRWEPRPDPVADAELANAFARLFGQEPKKSITLPDGTVVFLSDGPTTPKRPEN